MEAVFVSVYKHHMNDAHRVKADSKSHQGLEHEAAGPYLMSIYVDMWPFASDRTEFQSQRLYTHSLQLLSQATLGGRLTLVIPCLLQYEGRRH